MTAVSPFFQDIVPGAHVTHRALLRGDSDQFMEASAITRDPRRSVPHSTRDLQAPQLGESKWFPDTRKCVQGGFSPV